MVDGGCRLREHRWVAIGHAGDHQADADLLRGHGHRRQQRPAVENVPAGSVGADAGHVVEGPEVVEPAFVGDLPDRPVGRDGRVLGQLQPDPNGMRLSHPATFVGAFTLTPTNSRTRPAIPSAVSPCSARISLCRPWGRYPSGRASVRTLPASPAGASASSTAPPRPPEPTFSSTVSKRG